jgi:hypothetical protein
MCRTTYNRELVPWIIRTNLLPPWAEPFFTKMAESMIRNFLVIDWTTESQKAYFSLVKYVLNSIFHFTSLNARVGHRNRINIFDLIKLIRSLSIGHFELRAYLKWIKNHRTSIFPDDFFLNYDSSSTQNCKFDLTFCSDVINTKRPGFEFFPPLPSSFTYKFTPVLINLFCLIYFNYV